MIHEPISRPAIDAALFPKLSIESIASWTRHATRVHAADGDLLIVEGQTPYPFYIVLEGRIQVSRKVRQREIVLANFGPRDFVGDVAILAGAPSSATVRADGESILLCVPNDRFRALVSAGMPETAEVVSALAVRAAEVGAVGRSQEKLAAVGRIAAGLAHELNNPSSSICRQAKILQQGIRANQLRILESMDAFGSDEKARMIAVAFSEIAPVQALDEVGAQDCLELLETWLELRRIPRPYAVAATMSDAGLTAATLQELDAHLNGGTQRAIEWLSETLALTKAAQTIETGARRISDIVERMRHYSHLDRSAEHEVDPHADLDAVLAVLSPRLANIAVVRRYCAGSVLVAGYGSELNQVWTNLIENAIDAMPRGGTLTVTTQCDDSLLTVEIADTGVGIPVEHQDCVFDPFFTTKDVGEGYGLGLDYVYRTIVRHCNGSINFTSRPGETRFRVQLPVVALDAE